MPFLFSFGVLAAFWTFACFIFGQELVPSLFSTLIYLGKLLMTQGFWTHLSITLFRGIAALSLTIILSLVTGVAAGRTKKIMDLISPLVATLQATPPILWVTLMLVWAGTGNAVPILVVFASLFPPMFLSVSMATASLDKRLFSLAKLYRVKKRRVITDLILPGIFPHFLAGFSFALGSSLKVAAVAEFLGASRGIGARIYWAYRMMEMENLFAWSLVLIGLGVGMDLLLIRPLRIMAANMGGNNVVP